MKFGSIQCNGTFNCYLPIPQGAAPSDAGFIVGDPANGVETRGVSFTLLCKIIERCPRFATTWSATTVVSDETVTTALAVFAPVVPQPAMHWPSELDAWLRDIIGLLRSIGVAKADVPRWLRTVECCTAATDQHTNNAMAWATNNSLYSPNF